MCTYSFFKSKRLSLLVIAGVVAFAFLSSVTRADAAVKYWYSSSPSDWSTLAGNWWDDQAHTSQSTILPSSSDDVFIVGTNGPNVNLDTWTPPRSIDVSTSGITFNSSNNTSANLTITGNVTFTGSSNNRGEINGNVTFNGTNGNTGTINGNVTFGPGVGNFVPRDGGFSSGLINGNAIYNDASGGAVSLSGNMVWGGMVTGTVTGSDGQPITNWTFNGDSRNAAPITGTVTFNDNSYNNGIITGNATFNGNSYLNNYGDAKVEGNATFNDNSYDYHGIITGNVLFNGPNSLMYCNNNTCTVGGTKTRKYTSDITPNADLTGWTIVADGAVVTVTGSIHDSSTIFQTANGGSFVPNMDLGQATTTTTTTATTTNQVSTSTPTTTVVNVPVVALYGPVSIGTSTVTLHGQIISNEGASSTIRGFFYGLTTALGSIASTKGIYDESDFTQTVNGLSCGTKYYFSAFASNLAGTGVTSNQTFQTTSCDSEVNNIITPTRNTFGSSEHNSFIRRVPLNTTLAQDSNLNPENDIIGNASALANILSGISDEEKNKLISILSVQNSVPRNFSKIFSKNLKMGDSSEDVRRLQMFLNDNEYIIAQSGQGSVMSETNYFGKETRRALIEFQKDHNIPATGYFGPMTRTVINKM